jgi:hypothetical protein
VTSGLPLAPYLHLKFSHNEEGSKAIHVAVKKQDGHYQILSSRQEVSPLTESLFSLKFFDLCFIGMCSLETYSSGEVNESQLLAAFIADKDKYTEGQNIDLEDEDIEPIYLQANFSSLYESSELVPTSEILRGDQYLVIKYHLQQLSKTNRSLLHKIILVQYEQASQGQTTRTILSARQLLPAQHLHFYDHTDLHFLRKEHLTNNQEYYFATAALNKFFFATKVSTALAKTPLDIETFLKQQGCYLISAGFQKKHWILEYYRSFRDQWLMSTSLGRSFVRWYYKTAYSYAFIIADSYTLRTLVIIFSILGLPLVAFCLLSFFTKLMTVCVMMILWLAFRILKRKNKKPLSPIHTRPKCL